MATIIHVTRCPFSYIPLLKSYNTFRIEVRGTLISISSFDPSASTGSLAILVRDTCRDVTSVQVTIDARDTAV